jgi:alpha-beta hydrolase superfamily lysophospholipase
LEIKKSTLSKLDVLNVLATGKKLSGSDSQSDTRKGVKEQSLGHSYQSLIRRLKASTKISGKLARVATSAFAVSAFLIGSSFQPVSADPSRIDSPAINGKVFPNVYRWSDGAFKPRAVVIAIHGLTMHGTVFETLARHLASQGILVYAPDLRGYGAWHINEEKSKEQFSEDKDNHSKIAYRASCTDVVDLVAAVKSENPNVPLYCIGESLGADVAMIAAGKVPTLIDGLIVSSPAIKRKIHLEHMALDVGKAVTSAHMTLNVTPYLKYFASEDARVTNEALNDPLVRKQLSAQDIMQSFKFIDSGLKFADTVPDKTPVLVLQGDKDEIIDSSGVLKLAQHLSSTDQTIKWFKGKGHLLLETSFISEKAINAVDQWLDRQVTGSESQMPLAVSLHKNLGVPLEEQLASQ